jgi:F0F1-type ATP synthase membrane subunit c/vacuolar-type H+-ATPase subunit K
MAPLLTKVAETATSSGPFNSKSFMVGFAMTGAAIGLGMVGQAYMKALGRNPESGKAASQIIIIAAMIEVTALLTLAAAIIVK